MPKQMIINGEIQPDNWQYLGDGQADISSLPEGDIVVPLAFWQANKQALSGRSGRLGVHIDSHEEPEQVAVDLSNFSVIAVNFPSFMDGRGYSTARILRDRYHYQGDIRAVGDVLPDQLFYMRRCGFSSFVIKEDKDINDAVKYLNTIRHTYQAASDNPNPLFRQR
jgi:uncharacterized protein (DUF934 family)